MSEENKRPPLAAMARKTDCYLEHSKERYIQDLKRNYARRLDDINRTESHNKLSMKIDLLLDALSKRGGSL